MSKINRKTKILIIVLAALLLVSASALIIHKVYVSHLAPAKDVVTLPDNIIGEVLPGSAEAIAQENGAVQLELSKNLTQDNEKFSVQNMLPGDSVSKYFSVKAYHDEDISLLFRVILKEENKNFADNLKLRVTIVDSGKEMYDGPFAKMNDKQISEILPKNDANESVSYYKIDAYLDTSLGNESQNGSLTADFQWYVDDGNAMVNPPYTGDSFDVALWVIAALSSFTLVIVLFSLRKKRVVQHE